MRVALLSAVLVAVAAVGCGSASSASTPSATAKAAAEPATSLTISYWPQGPEQAGMKRWTLRCGPAGGTHPRKAAACSRLAGLRAPFAPLRDDVACIQIYGGPQQATVTGTYRGTRVHAVLSLRDGCQIDRFKRLGFLVPGFNAAGANA